MRFRVMSGVLSLLLICSVATFFSSGEAPARDRGRAKEKESVDVTCHFAYRTSTRVGRMDEKKIRVTIRVSDEGIEEIARVVEPEKAEFKSVRVEVLHQDNSLIVRVYDKASGRMIVSSLFQFGTELRNQFHGGHGFTGLNYVYHPKDESELQFWCSVTP